MEERADERMVIIRVKFMEENFQHVLKKREKEKNHLGLMKKNRKNTSLLVEKITGREEARHYII